MTQNNAGADGYSTPGKVDREIPMTLSEWNNARVGKLEDRPVDLQSEAEYEVLWGGYFKQYPELKDLNDTDTIERQHDFALWLERTFPTGVPDSESDQEQALQLAEMDRQNTDAPTEHEVDRIEMALSATNERGNLFKAHWELVLTFEDGFVSPTHKVNALYLLPDTVFRLSQSTYFEHGPLASFNCR